MKPIHYLRFLSLVVLLALPARAQVTNFAIFKVTVYHQTNSAPPVTPDFPDAYYFGAQLNMSVANYYQAADFIWSAAPPTSPAYNANMPLISPNNFNYGSPFYATKAAFDADFGPGDYEMDGTFTNTTAYDNGFLTIPGTDIYSTNIAAYTPASLNQMQHMAPAQDLSVYLNSFDVFPGADEALTFINVFDPNSGISAYYTNDVSLLFTNLIVPANTLLYGMTYRVDTFFSSRIDTPDAGFNGALGIVGFDDLTYTEIITIPPTLNIAASGTNVVVSWPSLASNFYLQSTTNLLNAFGWNTVTNIFQPPGLTNMAIFPATGASRFYRLTSLAP
jgi:hypothetical protein